MTASLALYRERNWIAFLPAALVLAMPVMLSEQKLIEVNRQEEPPMAVSLLDDMPVESPPAIDSPMPLPPDPVRAPAQTDERIPVPDTRPMEATAPPEPARADPQPEKTPAPPLPAAVPQAPVMLRAEASLEATYVGRLRAYLESIKRYPTSREARLQRPTGAVRVWLDIERDGSLRDCGIEKSSDSMILDSAALSTVRQGRYPAFTQESFEGKSANRFTVNLEYKLDAGN